MADDDVLVEMLDVAADRLAAYAYLLTGSQSAAEELVQAAVVKVFSRTRGLGSVPQAEQYVRRTIRTMHVDEIRREVTWRRLLPGQARLEWEPDQQDATADRDAVVKALAQLPRQKRTAVVMRFYDDMSYAEIARAMRVSLGTVKRYLSDAIVLLGEQFDVPAERVAVSERRRR